MSTLIDFINVALDYLVLVADIIIVLALGLMAYDKFRPGRLTLIKNFVVRRSVVLAGLVALTATLGSLFFSEIMHYEPCKLCWLQRIFMYPLPLLLALALIKKDNQIRPYAMMLAVIGAALALYHYVLQVGQIHYQALENLVNCGTVGYSPSCTSYFFLSFGYITIPMMSLSAFVLIIVILQNRLKQ